jgi:hypothetical protein
MESWVKLCTQLIESWVKLCTQLIESWVKVFGTTYCYDLICFHGIKLDYLYVLTTDQIVIDASESPRL